MKGMFSGCILLDYLNLYNYDTSKVKDMAFLFDGCHKLKEIKGVENFNTDNVINFERKFHECYRI